MLDMEIDDAVEGDALAFLPDRIHIFSASWGPADDGQRVEGPGKLAQRAIHKAVTRVCFPRHIDDHEYEIIETQNTNISKALVYSKFIRN